MYTIKPYNQISQAGFSKLPSTTFSIETQTDAPHGILLRSYDLHNMAFPETLLAIARAGAGTNNIPIAQCTERGIPVFNTPGANANAVKELVLTALLISSRRVLEGANWVQTQPQTDQLQKAVENAKKQFTGPEIQGKTLGVVGLGAIGVLVANAALDLGMEVIGYDPYLTLESAWHLSAAVKKSETLEDLFAKSDYVTLHIPLNDKTKHTVSKGLLAVAKKQMRLLNFARGELVDTDALLEAIENKTISHYITDFPAPDLLGNPNIILTPHLGASTPESEENCAEMAAVALREYLLYGNIKNSVNFPNCIVPYSGKPRITVSHANIVNMIGQLGSVFTKHHINVDKMVNNSKGELAYNIIVCDDLPQDTSALVQDLYAISSVKKVRILNQEG